MHTFILGPNLSSEVERFSELLGTIPDDILMDVMASPPPKPSLPVLWNPQPVIYDD